MRNRFAHGYMDMKNEKIWETAHESIPQLNVFCEKTLSEIYAKEEFTENDFSNLNIDADLEL